MIRRTDIELNNDQLEELLYGSNLGRNADIADLVSVINEVDGSFSIFIDGAWGSGKTYFVKQTEIVLHALNEKLGDDKKEKIQNIKEFKGVSLSKNYYPVYYNAWEHDSDLDPLITLIGTLASEMKSWDSKIGKNKGALIIEVAASILGTIGIPINTAGIRDALGQNLLNAFNQEMETRKKFENLIDILIEDKADKLVLFIDELDRCSPAFAMKLLERIKFIFGYEKIIVVFSTNIGQLNNMVRKLYGEETDGRTYLSRFYDKRFHIRSIKGIEYISALVGVSDDTSWLSTTVAEMSDRFTLRDCNRYLQELERHLELKKEFSKDRNSYRVSYVPTVFWQILTPILLAIKIENPNLYRKIISGNGQEEFIALVEKTNVYDLAHDYLFKMSLRDIYNECFLDDAYSELDYSFRGCALKFISKDK